MDLLASDFENADTLSIETLALEEPLQQEISKEIAELERLKYKVSHLHTSVLYYRNPKSKVGAVCYEAWKNILKKIGGSPYCWRDLGHYLGISPADLDYIRHSIKDDDPTDIVLKVFRQDEKATLDKIVEAFITMKRYDILKTLEGPLTNLAICFNREDKSDTGYHSNSKDCKLKEIISFNKIPNDLPPALSKDIILTKNKANRPNRQLRKMNFDIMRNSDDETRILFLSYTEDGMEAALNIQDKINNWSDDLKAVAITLNDRRDEVLQNPDKFIRECFLKCYYVVPIVTPGYFEAINNYENQPPNASENLDCKYVNYIYNLIINHYMYVTACSNKKVRSVLPEDMIIDFMNMSLHPELMPWTNEYDFDEQFKEFFKHDDDLLLL